MNKKTTILGGILFSIFLFMKFTRWGYLIHGTIFSWDLFGATFHLFNRLFWIYGLGGFVLLVMSFFMKKPRGKNGALTISIIIFGAITLLFILYALYILLVLRLS